MDIIEQTKQKMKDALEHLKNELKSIRTGRANPSMLDGVQVEIYGSMMRLKDIATVTAPESRQLLITPFDRQNAPIISKAIERANLGIMPMVDGHLVRIKIPPMDESVRKDMVKMCHKRAEECKVHVRNIRRDANEKVRKDNKEGITPEDLMKKQEKQIQELTDKACKDAEDICASKEKEVMTI
jgi:ribosome recycling factor